MDYNNTEKSILKIREELEHINIPEQEVLDKLNYEMTDIFIAIKSLKDKINVLENRFGDLAQYGIADELNNLKD
jgi:uncharacterized coiled-coil protein SlyX